MSVNTVMISNPFILLPGEKIRFESPKDRTSFALQQQYVNGESGQARVIRAVGKVYVTNKRVVVISNEGDFKSLSVLLQQVKGHKLVASVDGEGGSAGSFIKKMFNVGASAFEMMLLTRGDDTGIGLVGNAYYKLTIVFKEGGIYQFVKTFEVAVNDAVNDQIPEEALPAYSA